MKSIPDIDYLTEDIITKIKDSDKVLLDGTFYKKNELIVYTDRDLEIDYSIFIDMEKRIICNLNA